jgi:hypothetical protein
LDIRSSHTREFLTARPSRPLRLAPCCWVEARLKRAALWVGSFESGEWRREGAVVPAHPLYHARALRLPFPSLPSSPSPSLPFPSLFCLAAAGWVSGRWLLVGSPTHSRQQQEEARKHRAEGNAHAATKGHTRATHIALLLPSPPSCAPSSVAVLPCSSRRDLVGCACAQEHLFLCLNTAEHRIAVATAAEQT